MLKRRSVTGTDGTIWQSMRAQPVNGDGADAVEVAADHVCVTFQGGAREVDVILPRTWVDHGTWPDWVIVGEIERTIAKK